MRLYWIRSTKLNQMSFDHVSIKSISIEYLYKVDQFLHCWRIDEKNIIKHCTPRNIAKDYNRKGFCLFGTLYIKVVRRIDNAQFLFIIKINCSKILLFSESV